MSDRNSKSVTTPPVCMWLCAQLCVGGPNVTVETKKDVSSNIIWYWSSVQWQSGFYSVHLNGRFDSNGACMHSITSLYNMLISSSHRFLLLRLNFDFKKAAKSVFFSFFFLKKSSGLILMSFLGDFQNDIEIRWNCQCAMHTLKYLIDLHKSPI